MEIRILLADDHPLVRSGIRTELSQHDEFEVIGEALTGDEALTMTRKLSPDILLLDVNMPGMKAVKVLETIKQEVPSCRVIVLTAYKDVGTIFGMLRARADGYIVKDEEPERISEAIDAVSKGQVWISNEVKTKITTTDLLSPSPVGDGLTDRESDVLKLVVDGLANKQIAEKLHITERTVEFHLCNIFRKLGVNSRVDLILWVNEHGFP